VWGKESAGFPPAALQAGENTRAVMVQNAGTGRPTSSTAELNPAKSSIMATLPAEDENKRAPHTAGWANTGARCAANGARAVDDVTAWRPAAREAGRSALRSDLPSIFVL